MNLLKILEEELQRWGEVIIRTASGATFELHRGDTKIDHENQIIRFKSADAEWVIDGKSLEVLKMHWSHPEEA
ncbi:MAG: hypothetical protein KM310_07480 [Clostridiales bacterium]|nr:hypothetical protein [Clostridiales bacterium]